MIDKATEKTNSRKMNSLLSSRKRYYFFFSVLVLSGLAFRMGFVAYLGQGILWPDENRYVKIADRIVNHGCYAIAGKPENSAPVLPVALSLSFKLFGQSIFIYRIFQSFLGSCLCIIVFCLGKEYFDIKTAIIASSITAIYPYFIYIDGLLLPQSLLAFTLSVGMLLLKIGIRKSQLSYFVFSGAFFGICVLTVVPVLAFFPFIGIFMLLIKKVRWNRKIIELCL